jgi:hypothetical protein
MVGTTFAVVAFVIDLTLPNLPGEEGKRIGRGRFSDRAALFITSTRAMRWQYQAR